MNQSQFDLFPILKESTILQFMEAVNVPLTEEELTEPNRCKERVREVFVQLLKMCLGLTDHTFHSLPKRIVTKQLSLSHPELYNDALFEVKFFSLLSKLLQTCGYYEFGFKDLMMPQKKRFQKQLSAIINFIKYKHDMGHLVAQVLDEREKLFAALDNVIDNHTTLKDHVEEARTMNHEKILEREEAEAECREMEAEIAQQNKIQSSIRQETYLLKKSVNGLKDQIANLSIAQRELQAEERKLSKEVVHSPDRIKVDLAEKMQKLEGLDKNILAKQRELTLVHKQVEHTTLAEESVKEIMMVMEKMETKVQEHEIIVEDCDDVKNRLEEMERDLEDKRGERAEQETQLEVVEKQKSDTIARLTSVLQTAQKELESTTNRLDIVEFKRSEGTAQVKASKKRVEELQSHIGNDRKKAEEEIANRIASFHKLETMYWAKEEPLNSKLG